MTFSNLVLYSYLKLFLYFLVNMSYFFFYPELNFKMLAKALKIFRQYMDLTTFGTLTFH